MKHFLYKSQEDNLKSKIQSARCSKDHFHEICSKEFEYSVNPAKESNFSNINAKSGGFKSKAHNDALAKIDQYFSEQSEEPKCSRKESFDTESYLEKDQFSDRLPKKAKALVKRTSLGSIILINVKSAACQYEAENDMLDNKVLETNEIAFDELPDINVSRKQCFDTDPNLEKEKFSDQFLKKAKTTVKYTSLDSIITINVKSAACQYEAENNMLDDKSSQSNVKASEESPDIMVTRF